MHRWALLCLLFSACYVETRHRIPLNASTPQTRDEIRDFIENAKRLGCVYEEVDDDKKPAVRCDKYPGAPKFVFLTDNHVLCGVHKGNEDQCMKAWNDLGTPAPR